MRSRHGKSTTRLSFLFARVRRQIWFRAVLISLGSILLAVLAAFSNRYMSHEFDREIGQDAVGSLLQIIASSMLAVTTFSLTAMVTAYSSATQHGTPRATQLLMRDTTSQNALSTFLGAFVFAIVGIIGLQSEIYGNQGRLVLFAGTVILILIVVVTLLRWIAHLTTFGRMSDVIDRVEDAATASMKAFAADPHLGARPLLAVPTETRAVESTATGYVSHVDIGALMALAADREAAIYIVAIPGTLVHPSRALVHVSGRLDEDLNERIRNAFSIERHRTYDYDPRFGLIALSEIGSRALAPATNDPGTAIEVMNAMLRVLLCLRVTAQESDDAADLPPVYAIRPGIDDFLDDAFGPMLREGAGEMEVAMRLTKTLAAIRDGVPPAASKVERLAAELAHTIEQSASSDANRCRFADCHRPLWNKPAS